MKESVLTLLSIVSLRQWRSASLQAASLGFLRIRCTSENTFLTGRKHGSRFEVKAPPLRQGVLWELRRKQTEKRLRPGHGRLLSRQILGLKSRLSWRALVTQIRVVRKRGTNLSLKGLKRVHSHIVCLHFLNFGLMNGESSTNSWRQLRGAPPKVPTPVGSFVSTLSKKTIILKKRRDEKTC